MTLRANMARLAEEIGGLHSAHFQGANAVGFGVQGLSEWDWVNMS